MDPKRALERVWVDLAKLPSQFTNQTFEGIVQKVSEIDLAELEMYFQGRANTIREEKDARGRELARRLDAERDEWAEEAEMIRSDRESGWENATPPSNPLADMQKFLRDLSNEHWICRGCGLTTWTRPDRPVTQEELAHNSRVLFMQPRQCHCGSIEWERSVEPDLRDPRCAF